MRFLVMVKMHEDVGPPPPGLQQTMGREMGELFASGVMVDAGGLSPTNQSTEIRLRAGALSVTDGPYAEAKEVVGGYAILRVDSEEEALRHAHRVAEIHQQCWPGWEGSVEARRITDPEERLDVG